MQVEYSLTEDDLMALGRFQIAHSPVVQERFRTRRWLYPAGLAILAIGTYVLQGGLLLLIILLVLALLAYLFYPRYFDWIVERSIRRAVKRDMRLSSIARRTLRLTPEGLQQAQEKLLRQDLFGLEKYLLGSVAEKVVRNSRVPVLVVRGV